MTPFESIQLLQQKMNASIIGQENIVESLLSGFWQMVTCWLKDFLDLQKQEQ